MQKKRKYLKDYQVFKSNSLISRKYIKTRILRKSLLEYKCEECSIDPEWNGRKLVLQLDHINGINNDNRLCNLRFLCPNCHSQTHTYSRNKKK